MNFNQLLENVQSPSNEPPYLDIGDIAISLGVKRNSHKWFGPLNASQYNLTSFKGSPRKILDHHVPGRPVFRGNLIATFNKFKDLVGAPKEIEGYFSVSFCKKLTSAKGFPDRVHGSFYCVGSGLTEKELAKYDVGNKVNGKIFFNDKYEPSDKIRFTKAYHQAQKFTDADEQQDITSI